MSESNEYKLGWYDGYMQRVREDKTAKVSVADHPHYFPYIQQSAVKDEEGCEVHPQKVVPEKPTKRHSYASEGVLNVGTANSALFNEPQHTDYFKCFSGAIGPTAANPHASTQPPYAAKLAYCGGALEPRCHVCGARENGTCSKIDCPRISAEEEKALINFIDELFSVIDKKKG